MPLSLPLLDRTIHTPPFQCPACLPSAGALVSSRRPQVPDDDWFCGGCAAARAAALSTAGFGAAAWEGSVKRVGALAQKINWHRCTQSVLIFQV